MTAAAPSVVTGAFSYTGRYIAERLLALERPVKSLSRSPAPPGSPIEAVPLRFEREHLAEALRGAEVVYNTYWIRFERGAATFERAVANTRTLINAAEDAGVRRIVHLSVTNASEHSPLPYFRGKAATERALRESRLSHAIVRPTLIFGAGDILLNNIAWILRRFPMFPVPRGECRLQPVAAEDVAELAVEVADREESLTHDAAGPEAFTFGGLVRMLADAVGSRAAIVRATPSLVLALARLGGLAVRDVVLTRDELEALRANLLVSSEPPQARRAFHAWVAANEDVLGRRYASELARNFRPYAPL
ncbi:MAG: NAD(P)H-binding protein [Gaiellaceae bacterium]